MKPICLRLEHLYLVSEASLISLYAVLHSSQMSLELHAREILLWGHQTNVVLAVHAAITKIC